MQFSQKKEKERERDFLNLLILSQSHTPQPSEKPLHDYAYPGFSGADTFPCTSFHPYPCISSAFSRVSRRHCCRSMLRLYIACCRSWYMWKIEWTGWSPVNEIIKWLGITRVPYFSFSCSLCGELENRFSVLEGWHHSSDHLSLASSVGIPGVRHLVKLLADFCRV